MHNLEVEVGQSLRGFFIDDEGEPEAEAGDVNGTSFDVYAVDVLLDDVLLDFGPARAPAGRTSDNTPAPV